MNTFRLSLLALGLGIAPMAANAQDASWNFPYGSFTSENAGWDNPHRDQNGNLEIVNGIIRSGSGESSTLTQLQMNGGVGVSVGTATATAIGNQLNVITTGKYNTVIVNSEQTNNGDVAAGAATIIGDEDNQDDQG